MSFKNLILIVIACFSLACYSQTNITGVITNPEEIKWVVLHQYTGVQTQSIAKSQVNETGEFALVLPDSLTTGMYRLVYNLRENKYIDIIYTQENINITFDVLEPLKTLTFNNSPQNTQYYKALNKIIVQEKQLLVLNNFINGYNKNNKSLYKKALKEYSNNTKNIEEIYNKANATFTPEAEAYLKLQKRYYPNPKNDLLLQNYYSKQHMFNYLNPTNKYLLQSPIINDVIVGYIAQLRNEEGTTTQDYENAIDKILNWAVPNESLSKEITNFLANGFKMLDIPEAIKYIDINYKANQCESDNDTDLQQRLEAYKRLAKGKQAPEISWIDNAGNTQLLSKKISNNYTVIAFWASWCGSCKAILPSVNNYISGRNDVLALAIGLDDNTEDWLHEKTHYPNFEHIQAKEKWDNKIATDYAVYATPTFYVLDKNKKIIGKAKNLVELKALF